MYGVRILKESDGALAGALRSQTSTERYWTLPDRDIVVGENSVRYFTTSAAGAVDDADISLGSNTFGTDSYAALQALLDEAQNGPIFILWDGHYSISARLNIYSNTTIQGLDGCGVILRDNIAGAQGCFRNANFVFSSSSGGYGSNIVDERITIRNIIANGNNLTQGSPNSHNFTFVGVRYLTIENCQSLASAFFGWFSCNTEHLTIDRMYVDPGESPPGSNYDGIHVDGYARFTTVKNSYCQNCTDDNYIAMAEESANARGPVIDISFLNNVSFGGRYGFRISVGSTGYYLQNVIIDGYYGNPTEYAILLSNWIGSTSYCRNLIINNVAVDFTLGASFNELIRVESGTFNNVIIDNCMVSLSGSVSRLMVLEGNGGGGAIVNRLIVNNLSYYDAATGHTVAPIRIRSSATINFLVLNNFDLRAINSIAHPFISVESGGTLGTIEASNGLMVNYQNFVKTVSGASFLNVLLSNVFFSGETNAFDIATNLTRTLFNNVVSANGNNFFAGTGTLGTWNGLNGDTLSPAQITGDQNDYAPTGIIYASTVRLSTDASRTITGLSASQAGNREIIIMNVGAQDIVFAAENASSTAANRFATGFTLTAGQMTKLLYDTTASRWRQFV